jgi:hypothetical protein
MWWTGTQLKTLSVDENDINRECFNYLLSKSSAQESHVCGSFRNFLEIF